VGAPWLDVHAVLEALPVARLPGVQFLGVTFTPTHSGDGKHEGVTVPGIRMVLTDPSVYDPTLTAVVLLSTIRRIHPDSIGFRAAGFDRLAGGPSLREAILADIDPFAWCGAGLWPGSTGWRTGSPCCCTGSDDRGLTPWTSGVVLWQPAAPHSKSWSLSSKSSRRWKPG
jgi:hypothetical protein